MHRATPLYRALPALLIILISFLQDTDARQRPRAEVESSETDTLALPSRSSTEPVPIVALAFSGDSGPKTCRGHVIASINLERPASKYTNGSCYNMPVNAMCGVFVAEKKDACEAQLYAAPDCPQYPKELYITTAAFTPDNAALGGLWKSMLVRCAVQIDEAGLAAEQAKLQAAFGSHIHENKNGA